MDEQILLCDRCGEMVSEKECYCGMLQIFLRSQEIEKELYSKPRREDEIES